MSKKTDRKSLIEFPCRFPIKVMGEAGEDFLQIVQALVVVHDPTLDVSEIECSYSKTRKYISLTLYVEVNNQDQLDEIYRSLVGEERVKYVF